MDSDRTCTPAVTGLAHLTVTGLAPHSTKTLPASAIFSCCGADQIWGRKKRERKEEKTLPSYLHISTLSSMAKSKSIVLVQIKDNGAQRWFGIISSIKPGRLKGMQEEIHSLYEYVCTCCKSCWWWVHQARNKLNSQKHLSCHCCNWIA